MDDGSLIKATEAAKVLAISPRLLWTLTNGGVIPCVRIGRSVRYDPADLRCYIESNKTGSSVRRRPRRSAVTA